MYSSKQKKCFIVAKDRSVPHYINDGTADGRGVENQAGALRRRSAIHNPLGAPLAARPLGRLSRELQPRSRPGTHLL